jgi:small basic protein
MPNGSVTSDELVVSSSPVDEIVSSAQGELTPCVLRRIPLHTIFGRNLTEVVDNQLGVGTAGQETLISCYTDVFLALGFEGGIDGTLGSVLARSTDAADERVLVSDVLNVVGAPATYLGEPVEVGFVLTAVVAVAVTVSNVVGAGSEPPPPSRHWEYHSLVTLQLQPL